MPGRLATAVAMLLCAAALLQGCGGGGDGGAPAADPGGNPGAGGDTSTALPQAPKAPAIKNQPASQAVTVRQRASFQVSMQEPLPVVYQWQRNGVDVPGADSATYQFVVQPVDESARFRVRLANAQGSVTSEEAVLTVLDAPSGTVSLLAGSLGEMRSFDGVSSFDGIYGLAVDAAGNVIAADGKLRRVMPNGIVHTIEASHDDSAGVAIDAAGNLFAITSGSSPTLYRLAPDGTVTSLGSPGLLAPNSAKSIALDAAGRVVVADNGADAIVRIDPATGQATLLAAGTPWSARGSIREFGSVCAIAVDAVGNIVLTDSFAGTVRRLAPDGTITTVVPASAGLKRPCGLAIDGSGNLLVADSGNRVIRKVEPGGAVSVVAGTIGSVGLQDGPAAAARFTQPTSLAFAPNGDLYIADSHALRRLDAASGMVATFAMLAVPAGPTFGPHHATDAGGNVYVAVRIPVAAGSGYLLQKIAPSGSATTLAAGLSNPQGIAVDDAGNVYVADSKSGCGATNCLPFGVVLRYDPAQARLEVLTGSPLAANCPGDPGCPGGANIDGTTAEARFVADLGDLAVDAASNVYVAQRDRIRRIGRDGMVSTVTTGVVPSGLAVDRSGNNVYAAECRFKWIGFNTDPIYSSRLLRIDPASGSVTELDDATTGSAPVNPFALAAKSSCAAGIALDAKRNLFVAYTNLDSVRKLAPDGTTTVVAGQPGMRGITLGPLPAMLSAPTDVSFDASGNMYIGSTQAILKVRFDD